MKLHDFLDRFDKAEYVWLAYAKHRERLDVSPDAIVTNKNSCHGNQWTLLQYHIRNISIFLRRVAGIPYQRLATEHNISRGRVLQIEKKCLKILNDYTHRQKET